MSRGTEFRVGILVIAAIVATTTWLLILKEFKYKTSTFPVHVSYSQVAGIKSGADVRIRGVSKGKVGDVELQRDRVRLTLEIEDGTFIAKDARFVLQSDLINPTSIRIEQGAATEALVAGAELAGEEMVGLAAVLEGSSSLLGALQILATRLDSLTASGRLDRLVANLEAGSNSMKLWTEESRVTTRRTLERVDALTAVIEEVVVENREPLKDAIVGAGRMSVRADSLADELAVLLASLNTISGRLENGEGSMGKLMTDEELYERVTLAVTRVEGLLLAIKHDPRRFFSFSIF